MIERSARGVSCDAATCNATIVIEKTSAVTVIIVPAIADRTPRAPSTPPPKTHDESRPFSRR